jgi:hypothetical protein
MRSIITGWYRTDPPADEPDLQADAPELPQPPTDQPDTGRSA